MYSVAILLLIVCDFMFCRSEGFVSFCVTRLFVCSLFQAEAQLTVELSAETIWRSSANHNVDALTELAVHLFNKAQQIQVDSKTGLLAIVGPKRLQLYYCP